MALHNPIRVVIYDADDNVVSPVTRPISIVHNLEAFSFDYPAIQIAHDDPLVADLLPRWANGEAMQYRIEGRFGVGTGDITSIYHYAAAGKGEFTLYGRSHKEILKQVSGWPVPTAAVNAQNQAHRVYSGRAGVVIRQVLDENFRARMGVPIQLPTVANSQVGANIEIDFRFDNLYRHLYEDNEDNGGVRLDENGNIILDIYRDFENHRYVLTMREPTRHLQRLTPESGIVERWQYTGKRGDQNRIIGLGPGELLERKFVLRQGPMDHYIRPAEGTYEVTNPIPGDQDATDAEIIAAMNKAVDAKIAEDYSPAAGIGITLSETAEFTFGETLRLGDWVRLGIGKRVDLGEFQITKAVASWTRDKGYELTLTTPEVADSPQAAVLKRIRRTMWQNANETRRA